MVANDNHVTSDIFKTKLKQWRMMFFYEAMRDLPLKEIVEKYKPKDGLYLQMNLANNITKFPLDYEHLLKKDKPKEKEPKTPSRFRRRLKQKRTMSESKLKLDSKFMKEAFKIYTSAKSRDKTFKTKSYSLSQTSSLTPSNPLITLPCSNLRVHYFFTEDFTIDNFIRDTVVQIRLTNGENWKDLIAEGKLNLGLVDKEVKKTVDSIINQQVGGSKDEIIKIENINTYMFFFDELIDPYYMKIKVSYKFDQQIQTEKLDLWKYNSVFLPENSYFNSNPLPIEWLEMFEKKEKLGKNIKYKRMGLYNYL